MSSIHVESITIYFRRITEPAILATLQTTFGISSLPLQEADIVMHVNGLATAFINAVRRTGTDEMLGHCLQGEVNTKLTTEKFMLPQFVLERLNNVSLAYNIVKKDIDALRFTLDASNPNEGRNILQLCSDKVVYMGDLQITAGQLSKPIFNPTTPFCTLQPGARIVIENIHVVQGFGRNNGYFQVGRRAAFKPLDIPEVPREETHLESGAHVDKSGFTVSTLVARPRRFRFTVRLNVSGLDTSVCTVYFSDVCNVIIKRLRSIDSTISSTSSRQKGAREHSMMSGGILYTAETLDSGLSEGVLQIPGETDTIGEIIKQSVVEVDPGVAYIGTEIVAHENRLKITIRHAAVDVTDILGKALKFAILTYENLIEQVMKTKIAVGDPHVKTAYVFSAST